MSASQNAGTRRLGLLARHGRPGTVELLGAAARREGLQGMDAEPTRVGRERGERRRAADVCDPGSGRDGRGDLADGAVGHAQQDEIRTRARHLDVPLQQARRDGAADASTAQDVDARESSAGAARRVLDRHAHDRTSVLPAPRSVKAPGRIIPGMLRPFRGVLPVVDPSAYVDASAQVIGQVTVGRESSLWMNVVVRGDVHWIRIGRRTNLQDGTIVHVMRETNPTSIGDEVTIGHGAIVHGCTIQDRCLIGMGAIVLNGVVVGEDSIVAAGSLVPERMEIAARSLVMGSPARVQPGADRRRGRVDSRLRGSLRHLSPGLPDEVTLSTRSP